MRNEKFQSLRRKRIGHFLYPLLTAALAACDQGSGSDAGSGSASGTATVAKTFEGPKPEGVSSPNEAVTRTYYIPATANSDTYEIQASKLALDHATDLRIKAFAQMMVSEHGKTAQALHTFVASHPVNIAIPSNLDARHRAMIDNLEGASPTEFDEVYVGQQAAAHQEALNLQKSYASKGDDKALAKLARTTAAIVERHSEMVKDLEKSVGAGHQAR